MLAFYCKLVGVFLLQPNLARRAPRLPPDTSNITIGDSGNWRINRVDTGVPAQGAPGQSPNIRICEDTGYWYIGEVNTGFFAGGQRPVPAARIYLSWNGDGTWEASSGGNGSMLNLPLGGHGTLTATVYPANAAAQTVLWETANGNVHLDRSPQSRTAMLTGNSVEVTVLRRGSATITATVIGNGTDSVTTTVTIIAGSPNVVQPPSSGPGLGPNPCFCEYVGEFVFEWVGGVTRAKIIGWNPPYPTPSEVVIPSCYGGHPVGAIAATVFQNRGLTGVTLPKTLLAIEADAFTGNRLTGIAIPGNVRTIGNYAFGENSLYYVIFYGNDLISIGDGAFFGNRIENNVILPDSVEAVGARAFQRNLIEVLCLSANLVSIGIYAFANNSIAEIEIPDSVVTIGNSAFRDSLLTGIVLPSSLTSIGANAFENNSITGSVTIPPLVHTIGAGTFRDNVLTGIAFPSSLTSIGNSAFENNSITGTVSIPPLVHTVGASAFRNDNRTSLTGGNRIDELIFEGPRVNTNIERNAFYNNNIARIIFAEGIRYIGYSAFFNSIIDVNALSVEMYIPSTIHTIQPRAFHRNRIGGVLRIPSSVTALGMAAFAENQIEEVCFEPGVSIQSIQWHTFFRNSITRVNIPRSVTVIGGDAFAGSRLERITIGDNVTITNHVNIGTLGNSFVAFYTRPDYYRRAGIYTFVGGIWTWESLP